MTKFLEEIACRLTICLVLGDSDAHCHFAFIYIIERRLASK